MSDVLLIAGSPAPAARSTAALTALQRRLEEAGVTALLLEVRDLPPAALLHAESNHPAVQSVIAAVQTARVVTVATPVYKAAYTGALKALLDLLPQDALAGKLAVPIATAGSPAHLLVLEYALKPVLAALGARRFASGVYINDAQIQRVHGDGDGGGTTTFRFDAESERRLDRTAEAILQALPSLPVPDPAGPVAKV